MAPSQQVETMETIIALKRKIRREKEAAASGDPIQSATNRYNKLKMGANYVRAGSLPYPRGPTGYKHPIEHAGYTRNILARNPRRYNDHGDELEDSDSDPEADADAQEENPYSGIRLEELLCPLKHPSELATHPSLSVPYRDPALADMVASTEEKLRQERVNLWNAKALQRQLIGDESWMPLERVETPDDWDLFEPKPRRPAEASKKRKRDEDEIMQNGVEYNQSSETGQKLVPDNPQKEEDTANGQGATKTTDEDSSKQPDDDTAMQEVDPPPAAGKSEHQTTTHAPEQNGRPTEDTKDDPNTAAQPTASDDEDQAASDTTPPPPSRRITRALAAEDLPDSPPPTTSPSSPSPSPTLLTPDPIFLLPPHLLPPTSPTTRLSHLSSTHHLPPDELLETRRLLVLYIQKQEESVRGYEALLQKLLKAKHMRSKVWEWCKAEAHVGEWSDGEDWIDGEVWGLGEGELRKGRDEDEAAVDDGNTGRVGGLEGERVAGGGSGGGGGALNGVSGSGGAKVKGKGRRRRAAAAAAALTSAAAAAAVVMEKERVEG